MILLDKKALEFKFVSFFVFFSKLSKQLSKPMFASFNMFQTFTFVIHFLKVVVLKILEFFFIKLFFIIKEIIKLIFEYLKKFKTQKTYIEKTFRLLL